MTTTSDAAAQWAPPVRCAAVPIPDEERDAKPRNVRFKDPRWDRFGKQVAKSDDTRTRVINQFVAWYNREPGAKLPQRPDPD